MQPLRIRRSRSTREYVHTLSTTSPVTPERAEELLRAVAAGTTTVDTALTAIVGEPVDALDFATIDHHRTLRQGFPEVIFGEGKTTEQIVAIAQRIVAKGDGLLVTRAAPDALTALSATIPNVRINTLARTAAVAAGTYPKESFAGALVVTAGTSDLPVAEEATETLRAMHCRAVVVADVGVAGIHRLLARSSELHSARVIIVVAGMDGALPSVVGGLVGCPVIAVPTSVGYGTAFGGVAPLLTALNSCASGVVVVNIDNGFGAAMAAMRILISAGSRNVTHEG